MSVWGGQGPLLFKLNQTGIWDIMSIDADKDRRKEEAGSEDHHLSGKENERGYRYRSLPGTAGVYGQSAGADGIYEDSGPGPVQGGVEVQ